MVRNAGAGFIIAKEALRAGFIGPEGLFFPILWLSQALLDSEPFIDGIICFTPEKQYRRSPLYPLLLLPGLVLLYPITGDLPYP